MAGPSKRRQRLLWTKVEDDKLVQFISEYPDQPLSFIVEKAQGEGLDRDYKSCWWRYNTYLKPYLDTAAFTCEEDYTIIRHHCVYKKGWSFIAKHYLGGRPPNAIKNRWNNHLKKRFENMSMHEQRLLLNAVQLLLTDDETSDHPVRGDILED